MKFVKHFYYPYYYIETFNGSLISVFFLDKTFHFEDEKDIFMNKCSIKSIKKGKKVIENSTIVPLENQIKNFQTDLVDNFFLEIFKK